MRTDGMAAPGFEPVLEAFRANFLDRAELGAAVCVLHRGRVAVDAWAGWTDESRTRPWERDTLVHVYSTTKPLVATCALLLADRNRLALDAPVADYWPEFGAAGKAAITVRELLSHRAGLQALPDPVPASEIFDWDAIVRRLAAAKPSRPEGTAHGEHAYFYGHLVGELVRRVDGRGIAQYFAEELAGPWKLDFQIGVRPADRARVAPLSGLDLLHPGGLAGEPGSLKRAAVTNPPGMLLADVVNSEAWMSAAVPAVNGYGTAAAVARFYQAFLDDGMLDGERVLSHEACREATSVQSSGLDAYLEEVVDWGLGFQIEGQSFGHGGLGGSSGYADRGLELAFGYVTNLMAGHERGNAVADAAEACARSIGPSH